MNDMLAIILVGLVLVTALVSVFTILTGSSEPYSEKDYPHSDTGKESGLNHEEARPARRSGDRRAGVLSRSGTQPIDAARMNEKSRKNTKSGEGVTS